MTWLVDTFLNLVSGMGTGKDKQSFSSYALPILTRDQLIAMYHADWVSGKVVDIVAEDMTREWRTWQGTGDGATAIENLERALAVRHKVTKALKMARLFGGAAIVLGVDGQGNPDQPLFYDRVRQGQLKYLSVLSRHEIAVGGIIRDPAADLFGEPEYYTLNVGNGNQTVRIHPSRVVRFVGVEHLEQATGVETWGYSILQRVYDTISQANAAAGNLASLTHEAKVDVVTIKNLSSILANEGGSQRLLQRFQLANIAKSVNNTLLLDEGETWNAKTLNLSGFPDVVKLYIQMASGASDIPVTRLLGQSPGGLNSTGEHDLTNYYDMLASWQENHLRPAIEKLDQVLVRSALGNWPNDLWFDWSPLWQMSAKDMADIFGTKVTAIVALRDSGLVPPEALAEGVKNMLIEDGVLPGIEAAYNDAPPIDFTQDPTGGDTTTGGTV